MNIDLTPEAIKGFNSLREAYNLTNKTSLTATKFVELVVNGWGEEEYKRIQTVKRDRVEIREIAELAADATDAQRAAAKLALTK